MDEERVCELPMLTPTAIVFTVLLFHLGELVIIWLILATPKDILYTKVSHCKAHG